MDDIIKMLKNNIGVKENKYGILKIDYNKLLKEKLNLCIEKACSDLYLNDYELAMEQISKQNEKYLNEFINYLEEKGIIK